MGGYGRVDECVAVRSHRHVGGHEREVQARGAGLLLDGAAFVRAPSAADDVRATFGEYLGEGAAIPDVMPVTRTPLSVMPVAPTVVTAVHDPHA